MKKIVILTLVVILCLSLVACGEKKNTENEQVKVTEQQTEVQEEPQLIVVPEVTEEPEEVISEEDAFEEEIPEEEISEEEVSEEEISGEVED